MARVTNPDSFQMILKQFKGLLTKAQMKRATTDDLLELKDTIEVAITVLNEQVQKLSCIKLGQSYKAQPALTSLPYQQYEAIQSAALVHKGDANTDVFATDAVVGLYDIEAEVTYMNEQEQLSRQKNTPLNVMSEEDEVDKLNEIFASVEDVK